MSPLDKITHALEALAEALKNMSINEGAFDTDLSAYLAAATALATAQSAISGATP